MESLPQGGYVRVEVGNTVYREIGAQNVSYGELELMRQEIENERRMFARLMQVLSDKFSVDEINYIIYGNEGHLKERDG